MTARYQFYLDGTYYVDPVGWPDWEGMITRDQEINGIIAEDNGKFTFTGDAYLYLYSRRKLGYCATVHVLIKESCNRNGIFEEAFRGTIFLSDVKFNITKQTAACEMEDDSYFSKIKNNKSIECSLNAGKSKNGFAITAPKEWLVSMFDPCSGSPTLLPRPKVYRFHDVVKYMIDFMSDGTVGFRSTVLDIGGEFEGVALTKGILIRSPGEIDKSILVRFDVAIRNIQNLCNLSFTIENNGTGPVFVLEKTADTYVNATLLTFENVYQIERFVDQERNYAAVELGSEETMPSTGCGSGIGDPAFPDQINLLGPKREQFAVTGTCNIDMVKDLTCSWILSSNLIEQTHINGGETWDNQIFVIDCENLDVNALTCDAIQGDVFGTSSPVFYNNRFYNNKVAERHLRGIPATLVKYLNVPETAFKAFKTGLEIQSAASIWNPIPFGDDFTGTNNDLNNDWGNGTTPGVLINQANSRYTASAQNLYKFKLTCNVLCNNSSSVVPTMNIIYQLFDTTNTLLSTYAVIKPFTVGFYTSQEFVSPFIFMSAGDYITVRASWTTGQGLIEAPQIPISLELVASGHQGGEFQIYNPEEYIADSYSFSVPMSLSQFTNIRNNPTSKIGFNDGKNVGEGWIDSVKFKKATGMAEFKLISTTT